MPVDILGPHAAIAEVYATPEEVETAAAAGPGVAIVSTEEARPQIEHTVIAEPACPLGTLYWLPGVVL